MDEIEKYDFRNGDEFSDFKLIVDGKSIYVHKAILANVSTVFRKMFTTEFKEQLNGEAVLHGKKFEDIIELLKLIYPNYEKSINENNAERLLQLSDEYHIMSVKIQIEKSLIGQLNSLTSTKQLYGKAIDDRIDFITSLLNLSDMYILKRLKAECLEHLSASFSSAQLEGNSLFKELCDANKLEIYRKKLDLLEEKVKQKDERIKKMQDECLKQKFELKRLISQS